MHTSGSRSNYWPSHHNGLPLLIFLWLACWPLYGQAASEPNHPPVAIALHGGAGTIDAASMTPEREQRYKQALASAARAGHAILQAGGDSLTAIQTAINQLEDEPLFNAGKGAVYNAAGQHELDASIMDGATRKAGAVASVRHIRNPIDLALRVMTHSRHVLLSGEGAEQFAWEQGFEPVDNSYFNTEERWRALLESRSQESAGEAVTPSFFSTVGAVAVDRHGNLAAGTSTGGMTNKRFGRIGDSPIIGAGTFADNQSCAVSATGHGEYFIRWVVAYDICQRVARGDSIEKAAGTVINTVLAQAGGEGGVVAMDRQGNIAMPFNTSGMYRASINAAGHLQVAIYGQAQELPARVDQ